MPNFTRIYTDTQREAVIAARLDDHLTAKQVVKAAAEGQLADGPFEIPVGTVYRVGREGAREREAQRFLELARRDPNQAKSELVAEALASSIAKWTGCRTRTSSTLRPSHNSSASSRP